MKRILFRNKEKNLQEKQKQLHPTKTKEKTKRKSIKYPKKFFKKLKKLKLNIIKQVMFYY